jgi:hypothetical protein
MLCECVILAIAGLLLLAPTSLSAPSSPRSVSPHMKYAELNKRGYVLLDLARQEIEPAA